METAQLAENPLWAHLHERIDAIERLGAHWARAGSINADRIEQGVIAVCRCISSGISMLEYEATYHNWGGKAEKRALACLAQIRLKGAKHKWLSESVDQEKAILELTYEGNTVTTKFTIEQAKKQNLIRPLTMWSKDPSYMLRARCITTAIAMLAPEIVAGAEAAPDEAPQQLPELQLPKAKTDKHPTTAEEEEKALAKMGLAPATNEKGQILAEPAKAETERAKAKPEPAKAEAKPKKSGRKTIPGPGEDDAGEEPIPPPRSIEPTEGPEPKPPGPPPTMEPENPNLPPEIVDQLGHLFAGNFLAVALWLAKEKWVPAPEKELKTEAQAAHFLQLSLVKLARAKAKKILANKEAFMRAVKGETE